MTKKEKFNVAVAAFEALLSRNELWEAYMVNFSKCQLKGDSQEIYTKWKNWALNIPQNDWISSAFFWQGTPQERETWMHLDYYWLQWICSNLNN